MDAKELMLGDWVHHIDGYDLQIEAITDKGLVCCSGDFIGQDCMIRPILLTPEILKKNGIFKHKFKGHLEECYSAFANPINNEQFILWEETDRFELVLRHIVDNLTYSALRCKVRYVYELQHALRLCGIEKEIKL